MTVMTAAEILDKAAEVIEERGWHQGWFAPKGADQATAPVCVIGAINVVTCGWPRPGWFSEATWLARRVLRDYLGQHPDQWNDAKDRTAEQVISELRACAAELRGGAT